MSAPPFFIQATPDQLTFYHFFGVNKTALNEFLLFLESFKNLLFLMRFRAYTIRHESI